MKACERFVVHVPPSLSLTNRVKVDYDYDIVGYSKKTNEKQTARLNTATVYSQQYELVRCAMANGTPHSQRPVPIVQPFLDPFRGQEEFNPLSYRG